MTASARFGTTLSPVRRAGIVANLAKPGAARVLEETVSWLVAHGARAVVARPPGTVPAGAEAVPVEGLGGACDVLITIGGDGTLITAARAVIEARTPVLGVNLGGKLGFLTEIDAAELPLALPRLLAGGLPVEERMNIVVQLEREGRGVARTLAVNDAALVRGSDGGVINVELRIGDEELGTLRADGVVVSTPTGSTGYALSAGGPVLHPAIRAIVVTPVCPHTLSARPVMVHEDHVVEIRLAGPAPGARLTVDGHEHHELQQDDRLRVARAAENTRLVRLQERSFYARLREKFEWGGGHAR